MSDEYNDSGGSASDVILAFLLFAPRGLWGLVESALGRVRRRRRLRVA